MEKVLESVRKIIGGDWVSDSFNPELILTTNTILSVLNQFGVTLTSRTITEDTTWEELIPDVETIEEIKTYVTLRVKKIFDPPTGSTAMEALEETIKECEYRVLLTLEDDKEE